MRDEELQAIERDLTEQWLPGALAAAGLPQDDELAVSIEFPSFTCPHCSAVSHNVNDLRHGYCGRCHAYTR